MSMFGTAMQHFSQGGVATKYSMLRTESTTWFATKIIWTKHQAESTSRPESSEISGRRHCSWTQPVTDLAQEWDSPTSYVGCLLRLGKWRLAAVAIFSFNGGGPWTLWAGCTCLLFEKGLLEATHYSFICLPYPQGRGGLQGTGSMEECFMMCENLDC